MKTIAKNRENKINEILDKMQNLKVYSLSNNFEGKLVAERCFVMNVGGTVNQQDFIRFALRDLPFSKLVETAPNKYTVHIHDNEWYEFETA